MQAWSIRKDIVEAVSPEHLLILDLDCQFPVWHDGYWGYKYIVGRLHNFGARMSSLHGDMHLAASKRVQQGKKICPGGMRYGSIYGRNWSEPGFL